MNVAASCGIQSVRRSISLRVFPSNVLRPVRCLNCQLPALVPKQGEWHGRFSLRQFWDSQFQIIFFDSRIILIVFFFTGPSSFDITHCFLVSLLHTCAEAGFRPETNKQTNKIGIRFNTLGTRFARPCGVVVVPVVPQWPKKPRLSKRCSVSNEEPGTLFDRHGCCQKTWENKRQNAQWNDCLRPDNYCGEGKW